MPPNTTCLNLLMEVIIIDVKVQNFKPEVSNKSNIRINAGRNPNKTQLQLLTTCLQVQIWTEAIESPILSWPWKFHDRMMVPCLKRNLSGPKFGLSHRLLSKWFCVSALQNRERGGPWCYECGEDGWRYWQRQSFPIGHTFLVYKMGVSMYSLSGESLLVYATSFWCYQNTLGTRKRPQEYIQAAVLRRRLERLASKESLQSQPTAAWHKGVVEWPRRVGLFSESHLMPGCALAIKFRHVQ